MTVKHLMRAFLALAVLLPLGDARAADTHERLFQERCRMCHGSQAGLARTKLILKGGKLIGRYSGRDMAAFMPVHGVRSAEQAAFFLERLTHLRRRIEAGKPVGGKQQERLKQRRGN